jgi:hypothetical protein
MNQKLASLLIFSLSLEGCDAYFLAQYKIASPAVDIQPKLASVVDAFSTLHGLSCEAMKSDVRNCHKQPLHIITRSAGKQFVVCLAMIGTEWDSSKFQRMSAELRGLVSNEFKDVSGPSNSQEASAECWSRYGTN